MPQTRLWLTLLLRTILVSGHWTGTGPMFRRYEASLWSQ